MFGFISILANAIVCQYSKRVVLIMSSPSASPSMNKNEGSVNYIKCILRSVMSKASSDSIRTGVVSRALDKVFGLGPVQYDMAD